MAKLPLASTCLGFISLRHLYVGLLACALVLLLLHFFPEDVAWTVHNRLDVDEEANIPTWFATILLFSVSLSSLVLFVLSVQFSRSQRPVYFWLSFGVVYLFLSLDEAARLHEIFDDVFHVKWVFVYAPFGLAFFTYCLYSLIKHNESETLQRFVLIGLCVFAAGGLVGETVAYFFWSEMSAGMRTAESIFEEGLELVGTSTVLIGVLYELAHRYRMIEK